MWSRGIFPFSLHSCGWDSTRGDGTWKYYFKHWNFCYAYLVRKFWHVVKINRETEAHSACIPSDAPGEKGKKDCPSFLTSSSPPLSQEYEKKRLKIICLIWASFLKLP